MSIYRGCDCEYTHSVISIGQTALIETIALLCARGDPAFFEIFGWPKLSNVANTTYMVVLKIHSNDISQPLPADQSCRTAFFKTHSLTNFLL